MIDFTLFALQALTGCADRIRIRRTGRAQLLLQAHFKSATLHSVALLLVEQLSSMVSLFKTITILSHFFPFTSGVMPLRNLQTPPGFYARTLDLGGLLVGGIPLSRLVLHDGHLLTHYRVFTRERLLGLHVMT